MARYGLLVLFTLAYLPTNLRAELYETTSLIPKYVQNRDWTTGLKTAERREKYRLYIREGKLYDAKGKLYDTHGEAAIFVMDRFGNLYATTHYASGIFNHASFFDGEPVAGAGEMIVRRGELRDITSRSGHYVPHERIHKQVLRRLKRDGVEPYYNSCVSSIPAVLGFP